MTEQTAAEFETMRAAMDAEADRLAGTPPVTTTVTLTSTTLTVKITDRGLAEIALNKKPTLSGELYAEASHYRFDSATGEASLGAITGRTVAAVAPSSAKVTHTHERATVTYLYTLAHEDLRVEVETRLRSTTPLQVLGFRGLSVPWTAVQATGYLQGPVGRGPQMAELHPSFTTPVGASYQIRNGVGIAIHPVGAGINATITRWYADSAGSVEIFFACEHVGPDDTYRCAFNLRVSATVEWKALLGAYKTQFQATFGPRRYLVDARPVVQNASADPSYIAPDNPYGYHPNNRFDTAAGVQQWLAVRLHHIVAGECQGVIFWTINGWDLRGLNYVPDVHVVPPETEAQLPTLRTALEGHGLRMGREGQPSYLRTNQSWADDVRLPITADQGAMAFQQGRYDHAVKGLGCTIFFLDTFGGTLADVRIMATLRETLGPSIPTFTEFLTDIGCIHSGVYQEIISGPRLAFGHALEISQWLVPGVVIIGLNRSSGLTWEDDALHDWAYLRQLSPLIGDHEFWEPVTSKLVAHNATYLDPVTHGWLANLGPPPPEEAPKPALMILTVPAVHGTPIAITATESTHSQDWVAMALAGSAPGAYVGWKYLNDTTAAPPAPINPATVHITVPTAGAHVVRFFAQDGFDLRCPEVPVTVT